MSLMESVLKIRRWILREDRSLRSVARATGLSRNTVRKYLKDGSPPSYRRQAPPVRHRLCNGSDLRLQALFDQDMKRPRRERRTARKLYERLVVEGYTGSYSPVQRLVRDLKRAGADSGDAFIPLHSVAGDALRFDWSEERVVPGGVGRKIRVAHFRLCHSRKPFVMAYPGESREMVPDAFVQAPSFYGGVPRRVIIDDPRTMVTYVSRSKDRISHPRFLALMNHYVMEPVACTPAAGREKGQVGNQVRFLRGRLSVPRPASDDPDALNAWLRMRREELANRPHPGQSDRTVAEVSEDERAELRPLGRTFDGYVEKTVRVRSTCLVQHAGNRCSVPSRFAGQHVSLRAYAGRIAPVSGQDVIAEHKRRFTRNISYFEPWHHVPPLDRKPGALRDGAPFMDWQLPEAMHRIREHYMAGKGGDRGRRSASAGPGSRDRSRRDGLRAGG